MPANKVVYYGETLMDISDSTVTPETVVKGYITYDKTGAKITGTNPYEKTATDTAVNNALAVLAEKGVTVPAGAGVEDLETLISQLKALNYETWVFELEDGTTVEKAVYVG